MTHSSNWTLADSVRNCDLEKGTNLTLRKKKQKQTKETWEFHHPHDYFLGESPYHSEGSQSSEPAEKAQDSPSEEMS
jgi:hypothetical protein